MTQQQNEAEWGAALTLAVENGRVVGDTPKERMESAIEEVAFEMAEQGMADLDPDGREAFVKRHYNPR
jgi:hypothetical protein